MWHGAAAGEGFARVGKNFSSFSGISRYPASFQQWNGVVKPVWFSFLDSASVIRLIRFKSDSVYLINSDFGNCTWIGYKPGGESYVLEDTVLHISETKASGTFKADKVVIKLDSTGCKN